MGIISEIWRRSRVVFWILPTRLLTPRLTCVSELIPDPWWPRGQMFGTTSVKTQAMPENTPPHTGSRETGPRDACVLHSSCISSNWTHALTQILTHFQLINQQVSRPTSIFAAHIVWGVSQQLFPTYSLLSPDWLPTRTEEVTTGLWWRRMNTLQAPRTWSGIQKVLSQASPRTF